tara:strand:- start:872 stop:1225 length:354 start_codon:yes stop_codon:yes gene_type:complete
MNKIYHLLLLIFLCPLVACSLKIDSMSDILATDYSEVDATPEDSVSYYCDENKKFFIKYIDDNTALWIIYPNKQLKLIQLDNKNLYSNEVTTLVKESAGILVKNDSGTIYKNCVEKN